MCFRNEISFSFSSPSTLFGLSKILLVVLEHIIGFTSAMSRFLHLTINRPRCLTISNYKQCNIHLQKMSRRASDDRV